MKLRGQLSYRGWESTAGEKSRNAKLTDEKVREIRKSTMTLKQLAKKYDVSETCIRRIIQRFSWSHVLDELDDVAS